MKSNLLSVAQYFLLASLQQAEAIADPVMAQGLIAPGHLYIKTEITGASSIRQLINSSTKEQVGTSTFNQTQLPAGMKIAIERIRLGLAVVGTTDTKTAAAQEYTNNYGDTEPMFRAANFIIRRAGKEIFKQPVSRFLTTDNVQGMIALNDCYNLEELRLLQGNENLELQLEFPDDVTWTSGKKIFVSVELFGPKMQFQA